MHQSQDPVAIPELRARPWRDITTSDSQRKPTVQPGLEPLVGSKGAQGVPEDHLDFREARDMAQDLIPSLPPNLIQAFLADS